MNSIIIGTTPTIKYTFSAVSVTDITKAILTIKKGSDILIERDLTTATVGEDSISWTLTQQETLSIGTSIVRVMCNWLLSDGTRGASNEIDIRMEDNHKQEVI